MRPLFKWLGLALLLVAVVLGALNRERITRLMAVKSLFTAERIVNNFSNMDQMFLTRPMDRGTGPISPLPQGAAADLPPGTESWLSARSTTALVVLKDGALVHESYYQGTEAGDLRISWSVAKSFLSALTGIVLAEGAIESLDVPVTQYAPQLAGSAYDGASLRNVLTMSSGVEFDEDYLKASSDINKMGRTLAMGGSMDGFAAGQDRRFARPGELWQYVSIDTHVVGMVLRGATGRSVPDLMQEKIIAPLGLEQSPLYITDGRGVAFVLGGLNLTTRDYARFGQMVAQGGAWQGQQIVPEEWLRDSIRASAPGGARYGYQWWIPPGARPGEVIARGIYGQYLYIDQEANVVIAMNAADRAFRTDGVYEANVAQFRAIRDALD